MRGRILRMLEPLVLVSVPVVLMLCAAFRVRQSALLSLLIVMAALVVFFASWEAGKPALRQIMPTVVLAALAAAGRILFAAIPDVKPVSALCILAGVVFGRRSGFMVGALAALCSNFFFGQGAWTPWQMYSWGLVGYLSGVLAQKDLFGARPVQENRTLRGRRLALYAWGFLSALVFGLFMNLWTLVGFVQPVSWANAMIVFGAALPFDLVHGASTVGFLLIVYAPWRRKLERVRLKYGLDEGG